MLNYNLTQAPPNMLVVEVESAYNDTVEYGSITLHIDPLFKPTEHAMIYGRVVAVPRGKCYSEEGVEIDPIVRVGDKIYFHYLTTNDEANCIYGNYYRLPYFWAFCIVRNGRIIPVGAWTLCEEIFEEEGKFTKVEVSSQTIDAIVSASGIVTGIKKQSSTKYAKLKYIGELLSDQKTLDVSPNDVVVLAPNSNFKNEIEGKTYYTVRQSDILGKVMGTPSV